MTFKILTVFITLALISGHADAKGRARLKAAATGPEPILLDSDGAIFWDDGAALAMLLQHPEKVNIVGITTVIGNQWPYQAAEYLARVLKTAHRTQIPIYVGADTPLKNSAEQMKKLEAELIAEGAVPKAGFWKGAYSRAKEVRKYDDVEPVNGEALTGIRPQSKPAVDFIVETLMHAKKPITFVAIGPLTNLATALQKEPKIAKHIRRLLVMGGAVSVAGNTTPKAELNFLFDPEAADAVLSSPISEKLLFPLDLSGQATLNKERFDELTKTSTPYTALLAADRGPKFSDPNFTIQSWDTAVAAYLIDPNYILDSKVMHLRVSTDPDAAYGSVQVKAEPKAKVHVMAKMDVGRYFAILSEALSAEPHQ